VIRVDVVDAVVDVITLVVVIGIMTVKVRLRIVLLRWLEVGVTIEVTVDVTTEVETKDVVVVLIEVDGFEVDMVVLKEVATLVWVTVVVVVGVRNV
jgi:hypothetical protein